MDPAATPLSQDRLPDWLAEALDVLSARRRLVVGVAVGLVLLGGIVSLVAPSILPARPVVGVAVGIAAALLATALGLALDASDLIVRGARHVRAAGGHVDVRVGRGHDDVGPLLAAVARHATDGIVRVALTPASRSAAVPGPRATALAESIARTGRRVLLTDLTRSGSPAAGLSDVVNGDRSLSEVVRFEQEIHLARLAVGSDPDAAVKGFDAFIEALPADLEVLVVALPPLAEPGVLKAAEKLDLTLVLVEVDRTERVDLIASLDAMDAARVTSELVLIDPTPVAATTAGTADTPADEPDPPREEGPTTAVAEDAPEDTDGSDPALGPGIDEDETAVALAALLRREHVDDSPVANSDVIDLQDAVTDETDEISVTRLDGAPDEPEVVDEPAPEEPPAEADTPPAEPVQVSAAPVADETVAPDRERVPARVSATPARAPSPAADDLEEDAALEVARTSAALQQLAQQVWQRQAH